MAEFGIRISQSDTKYLNEQGCEALDCVHEHSELVSVHAIVSQLVGSGIVMERKMIKAKLRNGDMFSTVNHQMLKGERQVTRFSSLLNSLELRSAVEV